MTISLVTSDAKSGSGTLGFSLNSTEGNLQVVAFGHRSSSLTPSIDGDGWSSPYLIETEITNSSARRAIVMYWRSVPASQSGSINADFSSTTAKAGVAYEFTSDSGGAWSFDQGTGRNTNGNGTTETTSLASNSVTPEFDEAIALDTIVTRHGLPKDEDSYSDSFIAGEGESTGTSDTNIAAFSGYKIVDTSPAAMSTTASWSTSALATSIIGVWSVDTATGPTIAKAFEAEGVHGFLVTKTASMPRAAETEVARSFVVGAGVPFARAAEPELGREFAASKSADAGRASETEAARSFGVTIDQPVGRVTEVEIAGGFAPTKTVTMPRVVETETARGFTIPGTADPHPIVLSTHRESALSAYREPALPPYREA